MTINEVWSLYVETANLAHNRPEAVASNSEKPVSSYYVRKLSRIKEYAAGLKPSTKNEKIFLETILGRKVETVENVKVEWFPQIGVS